MFSGLLPLSPKRTQVRLKSPPLTCLALPDPIRTHGRPSVQEYRLRLKRPTPHFVGPLYLNPRPPSALLRLRPFFVGRFAHAKKYNAERFRLFKSAAAGGSRNPL